MRTLIVILLALVAVGSAGVWLLGEYGDSMFASAKSQPSEAMVQERELALADDVVHPAAPETANAVPSQAPSALPAPDTQAAPATPSTPNPILPDTLDATAGPRIAGPVNAPAPPPAAERTAPAEAFAQPQSEPAFAPAATMSGGATPFLASQFKSRKVTYNRPPAKLALNKAIDVSLVVNATSEEDAGRDALQGFPGTVVERDVDLSDTVSAQLTGVGFNIDVQSIERQKLSGKTINRWQWRVTPTEIGTRTLILEIFGYAPGSLDAEPLDAYRDDIVVEVQQQFDQVVTWAKGVQPVFAIIAAIAAAISALVAFLRLRSER